MNPSLNGHPTAIFNFAENDLLTDLIAIQGDALTDITTLRQVKFAMRGGVTVVDTFHTPAN